MDLSSRGLYSWLYSLGSPTNIVIPGLLEPKVVNVTKVWRQHVEPSYIRDPRIYPDQRRFHEWYAAGTHYAALAGAGEFDLLSTFYLFSLILGSIYMLLLISGRGLSQKMREIPGTWIEQISKAIRWPAKGKFCTQPFICKL
jgi:hypothetical protein